MTSCGTIQRKCRIVQYSALIAMSGFVKSETRVRQSLCRASMITKSIIFVNHRILIRRGTDVAY
jgi:hypothetical protein